MFAVCLRYSNSYQDAQDAFQDGFIKVFEHIKTYKKEQPIEGWIRRIMVNTCIDKHRKNSWITSDSIDPKQDFFSDDNEEEIFTLNCSTERLLELIQELPAQYRTVFNLYVFEDYSHQQIAERLQISVGTSKSNLYRAKKWLQKAVINETL